MVQTWAEVCLHGNSAPVLHRNTAAVVERRVLKHKRMQRSTPTAGEVSSRRCSYVFSSFGKAGGAFIKSAPRKKAGLAELALRVEGFQHPSRIVLHPFDFLVLGPVAILLRGINLQRCKL